MARGNFTERAIFEASNGRWQRQRLTATEEQMIVSAALEFQQYGTPLVRPCMMDLAQPLVSIFPAGRQGSLRFRDNRPGPDWLWSFLQRHPDLSL